MTSKTPLNIKTQMSQNGRTFVPNTRCHWVPEDPNSEDADTLHRKVSIPPQMINRFRNAGETYACMNNDGQTWKLKKKLKKSQIKLRLSWYRTKFGTGCYWMSSYKTVWEQTRIKRQAVANQSNTSPSHKHPHEQRKCTHQPTRNTYTYVYTHR